MGEQCPQCGHRFAPSSGTGSSSWEQNHDPPVGDDSGGLGVIVPDIGITSGQGPSLRDANRQSRSIGPKLVAGLLVAFLLGFAAIKLFGGADDNVAQAQDQNESPDPGVNEPGVAELGDGQGVGDNAAGGDPNFPPSDEHLAADRIGEVFQDTINADDSYAVAYHSQRGLQLLSARGMTSPEIEVAVGFDQAARYPLFSDGSRTWAVNTLTPDLAYLVSTQFVAVDVGLEGSVAFINHSLDPVNVGISSFGAWGPGVNVPKDAEILAVAGRGILIVPPTGGTFQLTQLGVDKISDDRVVAAGLNSQVFQRCDDELTCELYVTSEIDDRQITLDVTPTSQVYVSPTGRHVFSTESDQALLTNVETGEQWPVALAAAATGAAWSPDGRFVAAIAGESIVFAFEDQTQVEVGLPILPTSGAVLVLDS